MSDDDKAHTTMVVERGIAVCESLRYTFNPETGRRTLGPPRENHQVWKRSGEERVVRNAIGLPVRQPNASRNAPVVKNAIGLNPGGNGVLGTAKKPINTQVTASINRSTINGTGLGRPGSGTVAIGGAKRNVAGFIDGTSFRFVRKFGEDGGITPVNASR